MSYRKNWPTLLAYTAAAVAFCFVAAYALMYSAGYRLNFKEGALMKTGVLAVVTKPADAEVALNNKKVARKTPLTMRNLLPGVYSLTITLPNYRTFEYEVEIKSGQVTEVRDLELVLNDVKQTEVAEVKSVANYSTNILYLTKDGELIKLVDDKPTPFDVSKLSNTIKNQIKAASDINFIKRHGDGNGWALGLQIAGRKAVAIIDEGGYRGQFLAAPLNTVEESNLMWVDADRLLLLIGNTLYTRDLTLNRTNIYAKDVLGMEYVNGKLTYAARNKTGQVDLWHDTNVFDGKAGETYLENIPSARGYQLAFIGDHILLIADNNGVKGLWLADVSQIEEKKVEFAKLASNVGTWVADAETIFYSVGRDVFRYKLKGKLVTDTDVKREIKLRSFSKNPEILDIAAGSLYLQQDNRIWVIDKLGKNAYAVMDAPSADVKWLAADGKQILVARANKVVSLLLRVASTGLFSGLVRGTM
jgi:hypothetical protein